MAETESQETLLVWDEEMESFWDNINRTEEKKLQELDKIPVTWIW